MSAKHQSSRARQRHPLDFSSDRPVLELTPIGGTDVMWQQILELSIRIRELNARVAALEARQKNQTTRKGTK